MHRSLCYLCEAAGAQLARFARGKPLAWGEQAVCPCYLEFENCGTHRGESPRSPVLQMGESRSRGVRCATRGH